MVAQQAHAAGGSPRKLTQEIRLGYKEFRSLVASLAPEVCTNERALKGLYHAFDKRGQSWDHRGVRFKELASMVVVLSPAMPLEERLGLMFTLFDEDGNGLIDPQVTVNPTTLSR